MWIDQRGSEILARPECLRLLAVAAKDDHIGRLAVNDSQAPLVVPLNFTIHDRGVVVRTGPGWLSETVPGSLVSFEVDRVDTERAEAWSVLVRGLASALDPGDPTPRAGAMPMPLVPNPGEIMICIRPDVVTGRRFILVVPDGAETRVAGSETVAL